MRIFVDTTMATFFVGSEAVAMPLNEWRDGKAVGQAYDPANPTMLGWTIKGEVCQPGESPIDTRLKIFSATAPTVLPRTEYRVEGVLKAVAYKVGSERVALSFSLNGKLFPNTKQPLKPE